MDYTDKFFHNLKPANEQQQHFIYWVMMTQIVTTKKMPIPILQPRIGRLPDRGISAIHDVFYNSLHTSMQAMRVCEMADVMDEATRKRLEEMALMANSSVDAAAAIGSALLTLEEAMIASGERSFSWQFDRLSSGRWIVNKMGIGGNMIEAVLEFARKKTAKLPPKKTP